MGIVRKALGTESDTHPFAETAHHRSGLKYYFSFGYLPEEPWAAAYAYPSNR